MRHLSPIPTTIPTTIPVRRTVSDKDAVVEETGQVKPGELGLGLA
jgi:hypothetical protein